MTRFVRMLCWLWLTVTCAIAQERHAEVKLDDGRALTGRVLSMNVERLELEVGNQVLEIPAAQLRSCRFFVPDDPATAAAAEVELPEASSEPAGGGDSEANAQDPPAGEAAAEAPTHEPKITWDGPLADPVDPTSPESVPVDVRGRSHWQRRVQALDRAYPWLAPAAPSQWLSLGLLLLVASGLIVHMSVSVAGAEAPQLGRSCALGVWYIVTGLLQVAFVPIHDLSVSLMILGNVTLSLFGLCALFGLPRWGAVVALLVQLGFGVLVYGVLELVTSLLGSCGVTV